MNIAITTIQNSSNYGAMLQVFALQEYLTKLNHNVEIVNYNNPYMSKGLDIVRHGFHVLETYYFLLDIINFKDRNKMVNNFRNFSENYLKLGKLQSREELLSGGYIKKDLFISGSDQIWNPYVTNGMVDEVYFCGMYNHGSKVISYASSMGGYDFKDKEMNQKISILLKKYTSISTRESSYIPELSKLTDKKIVKVMDPVFLLTQKEWKSSLNLKKTIHKPYILIYAMAAHEKIINNVVKSFSDKKYDIVMIYEPLKRKKGVKYVVDAGPREFVELFLNADIIITNSFHGTSFGLIFQKKICVIDNARNMNRIYDLLNDIEAQVIIQKEEEPIKTSIEINYDSINKKLEKLINKSKEFLLGELV